MHALTARLLPVILACALPFAAAAQPLLPQPLLKSIKADPGAYVASVAELIAAYGAADGITEDQVATSIALIRAKARAGAMMPLISADLDGDGTVLRAEMVAAEGAASATGRARLERVFVNADADGDGAVSAEELSNAGASAAMAAFSPARMAGLKVLMGFDADGNGVVSVSEVRAGLSGLVS